MSRRKQACPQHLPSEDLETLRDISGKSIIFLLSIFFSSRFRPLLSLNDVIIALGSISTRVNYV